MFALKRKQLPWYALGGFGLNLLNTIATIYLADALIATGFLVDLKNWTFAEKTIVYVMLFSILKVIAQIVDGVIDIPFAHLTDNLKTKWGKRRPVMLIGGILTLGIFIAMCFPISTTANSIPNTIWYGLLFLLFYSAYTLTYVTYYGTYSEVCANESDRFFISNWKTFIDTVQYAIAYAVIPLIVGVLNIRWVALACAPLGLLFLIAVFLPKERSSLPEDVARFKAENPDSVDAKIADETPLLESIKLTVKNESFVKWLIVLGVFFFGLQMFLSGQNVLASGPMAMNSWQIAIINTSAFAPVPIMLILYKKVMKKKGFRFAFATALISFAIGMILFSIAYINWFPSPYTSEWKEVIDAAGNVTKQEVRTYASNANTYIRLAIGATGGMVGSYGIGAFFMAPYMIPAQAASEDKIKNKVSNPSMYFAVQGLVTALAGALSSGLLWPNLRNNFGISSLDSTFGAHLMPYIVAGVCVIAALLCFILPKSYDRLGKGNKEKEETSPKIEENTNTKIEDDNTLKVEEKVDEIKVEEVKKEEVVNTTPIIEEVKKDDNVIDTSKVIDVEEVKETKTKKVVKKASKVNKTVTKKVKKK